MTNTQFIRLSNDLRSFSSEVPLKWGRIQNDSDDSILDIYHIQTLEDLNYQISNLNLEHQKYFRRRWFLWKCSKCDEHIFNLNNNVSLNPNSCDKNYDIEFNNDINLRFDIKSTVVPRKFREDISSLIDNPQQLIDFYYKEQSKGVRYNLQKRLFIVHHSFVNQNREMNLRCAWLYKIKIYKIYSSLINKNTEFKSFNGVKCDFIFLFENPNYTLSRKFFSI